MPEAPEEGGVTPGGASRADGGELEFRILGPLQVFVAGRPVELRAAKPRALLTVLLLNANHVVPNDRLIDFVWGEQPPERARSILQTYVSQLRQLLEPERSPGAPARVLVSQPSGYLLHVEPGRLDLHRFEAALDTARRALAEGRPALAALELRKALELWRGSALAEFETEPAERERARLEEMRLEALEARIDADLELGRHAGLVGELRGLVGEQPLRERLRAQLMLALYRSGRSGDAVAVFHQAREALREELGMEPGPALQKLLRDILNQEPSLGKEGPAPGPSRKRTEMVLRPRLPPRAWAAAWERTLKRRRPPAAIAVSVRRWLSGDRRRAALAVAAMIGLVLGATSWAVLKARVQPPAPAARAPAGPCAFLWPGQPIEPAAGSAFCGVWFGQPWIQLDCSRAASLPGGFAQLGTPPARVSLHDGDCVFAPASAGQAVLGTVDTMPNDAVVVADFTPASAGQADIGLRCAADECLTVETGPSTATHVVDRVGGLRTRPMAGSDRAPANRPSRLVVWLQGTSVEAWLNGRFQGKVTTGVRSNGAAELSAGEGASHPDQEVRLQRFAVYYPAPQAAYSDTSSEGLVGTWGSPGGCGDRGEPPCSLGLTVPFEATVRPADVVNHVDFTANWGHGWRLVCRVNAFPGEAGPTCSGTTAPAMARATGTYGATWNIAQEPGIHPGGAVRFSFDVYGQPDDVAPVRHAPDHVLMGTWSGHV